MDIKTHLFLVIGLVKTFIIRYSPNDLEINTCTGTLNWTVPQNQQGPFETEPENATEHVPTIKVEPSYKKNSRGCKCMIK